MIKIKDTGQRKYDDIIDLPHHVSKKHPQMPLLDWAAQYAPFSALSGHAEAVRETERQTEVFAELDEEQKVRLNGKLQFLLAKMKEEPSRELEIEITFFQPDTRKEGGVYGSMSGKVKKIDGYFQQMVFADGAVLPLEHIFSIDGKVFRDMDGLDF